MMMMMMMSGGCVRPKEERLRSMTMVDNEEKREDRTKKREKACVGERESQSTSKGTEEE